ncbi:MAG: YggS family pyridoxal phosphate-dependent enzyme [Bacteroidales bacterium]
MSVAENIQDFLAQYVPENVKLVAVSKTKPVADIMEAYDGGYKVFGENKVQELVDKYEALPKDIEWHMIGHMQSNKVKYIAPFVHLIHGVDKFKLLKVINKEGEKNHRIVNCLLQFHIAEEETKFGLDLEEAHEMLSSQDYADLTHVNVMGVMGMATFTDNHQKIRKEFRKLKTIFDDLKSNYFTDKQDFNQISMGMSNDYKIAIEEGATMIRIGSLLFGPRNYQ